MTKPQSTAATVPTSFTVGAVTLHAPSAQAALDLATKLGAAKIIQLEINDWWRLQALAAFETGEELPPPPQRPPVTVRPFS